MKGFLVALTAALVVTAGEARAGQQAHEDCLCLGDYHEDGAVTVDELLAGVSDALDGLCWAPVCDCFDRNDNYSVDIDELLTAVSNALYGCPIDAPTWTPTPTNTPTERRPTVTKTPVPSTRTQRPTVTATRPKEPTSTRTLIVVRTPTQTATPIHTEVRSPTRTRTPGEGPRKLNACTAQCYAPGQGGGTIISEPQLNYCAEATSTLCRKALTYGKFGYDGYNDKLASEGLDVFCGSFVNNSPNDVEEIRLTAQDAQRGTCDAHLIVGEKSNDIGGTRFSDLITSFKEQSGGGVPSSILASHINYNSQFEVAYFRSRVDYVAATFYPQYDDGVRDCTDGLARLRGVARELHRNYPGKDIKIISGVSSALDGWSCYDLGAQEVCDQENCEVFIYSVADEQWLGSPLNPLAARFGIAEWGPGCLILKEPYRGVLPDLPGCSASTIEESAESAFGLLPESNEDYVTRSIADDYRAAMQALLK